MLKQILSVILICLFGVSSLLADDFVIDEFEILDFKRESYALKITAKDKATLSQIAKEVSFEDGSKEDRLVGIIRIGNTIGNVVPKSIVISEKNPIVKLQFTPTTRLEGKVTLEILDPTTRASLVSREYTVPERHSAKGKQPFIHKIHPKGGTLGDTITLYGTNLGENIDDLFVSFVKNTPDTKEPFDEHRLQIERPFYLAPTGEVAANSTLPIDMVKFTIPPKLMDDFLEDNEFNIWERWFLGKEIHFYLYVNNRPSSTHSLRILPATGNGSI